MKPDQYVFVEFVLATFFSVPFKEFGSMICMLVYGGLTHLARLRGTQARGLRSCQIIELPDILGYKIECSVFLLCYDQGVLNVPPSGNRPRWHPAYTTSTQTHYTANI